MRLIAAIALAGIIGFAPARTPAWAQASPPEPPPTPGDPLKTIPEKIKPKTPPETQKAPKGSLSDRLEKQNGLIKPPKDVDPKMDVQPPDPNPGNMPVIPPPGSPNNPSPVIPK